MVIELREKQPTTARPKTVIGVVNPGFTGITLPSSRLNPSRDGSGSRLICQVFYENYLEKMNKEQTKCTANEVRCTLSALDGGGEVPLARGGTCRVPPKNK